MRTRPTRSSSSSLLIILLSLCLLLTIVFVKADDEDYDEDDYEDEPPAPPAQPTPPPAPVARTVRFIRDLVPTQCPITVKKNYLVTMSYTAHLITPDNRVGTKFDETPPYGTITIQANPLKMMDGLMRGLMGACLDEKRSVIIPHELANLNDPEVPKETDIVFIVTIVDITPMIDYFDQLDIDRNGCVTKDEFFTFVTEQHKTAPHLIDLAVEKLMSIHDKDGDGFVECTEFSSVNKHCLNLTCVPVAQRRLEVARLARIEAERKRKEEEDRLAAEKAERERIAAEEAEIARILAEEKAAEVARLAEERRQEVARIVEERRQEAARLVEERRQEAARLAAERAELAAAEAALDAANASTAATTTP